MDSLLSRSGHGGGVAVAGAIVALGVGAGVGEGSGCCIRMRWFYDTGKMIVQNS
jgi:hypothetical protein